MFSNILIGRSFSKEILIRDFVLSLCLNYSSGVSLSILIFNSNRFPITIFSILPIIVTYLIIILYKHNSKRMIFINLYHWIDILSWLFNYCTINFESGSKLILLSIMIFRKIFSHQIHVNLIFKEKILLYLITGCLIELQIISTIDYTIIRAIIYSSYIIEISCFICIGKFKQIQFNYMNEIVNHVDISKIDSSTYCIFNHKKGVLFSNHKYHEIVKSSANSNCTEFLKNLSYIKLVSLFDILSSTHSNQNEFLLVRNSIDKSKVDSYLISTEKDEENKIIKFISFVDQEK